MTHWDDCWAQALTSHRRDAGSGLDRRSLIERAAAVGAAAWTAPVIIGSLASPAGAITVGAGCYRAEFTVDQTTCEVTRVTAANGAGCIETNYWNNVAQYPGDIVADGQQVVRWLQLHVLHRGQQLRDRRAERRARRSGQPLSGGHARP